jgi:hypothetical protein
MELEFGPDDETRFFVARDEFRRSSEVGQEVGGLVDVGDRGVVGQRGGHVR